MSRRSAAVRLSAAILGSLLLAMAASVCVARVMPFSQSLRFAMAHYTFVPIWITAACFGFTAKSGARAWAAYIALTALLSVLAFALTPWSPT